MATGDRWHVLIDSLCKALDDFGSRSGRDNITSSCVSRSYAIHDTRLPAWLDLAVFSTFAGGDVNVLFAPLSPMLESALDRNALPWFLLAMNASYEYKGLELL